MSDDDIVSKTLREVVAKINQSIDLGEGLYDQTFTTGTCAKWEPTGTAEQYLAKMQTILRGLPIIRVVHEIRVHPKSMPWLLILLRAFCVPGQDVAHLVHGGIRLVAAETLLPGVFETYDGYGRFIEAKRWSSDLPWLLLP